MSLNKLDEDLIRIKFRIDKFSKILTQGSIGTTISLVVSLLATLEITNGKDKVTIQEIYSIIKSRLDQLSKSYSEMIFVLENLNPDQEQDNKKIKEEKDKFRKFAYKLFDLGDIIYKAISKCVVQGERLNKILPTLLNSSIKPLTESMIDTIFLVDTDEDFETKIYEYINERTETIENYTKRKKKKIFMLHNVLKKVIKEENKDKNSKNSKNQNKDQDQDDDMIELNNLD